jgi:phospholipid transport system substrate-binding protein
MHRTRFFFVCLFSTLAAILPLRAATDTVQTPTQVVEKLHGALLQAMKEGPKLGFEGRRALLEPVVEESFDFKTMARVSTGSGWAKLSPDDQARIIATFTKFTVANYAGQFKTFGGEKFTTKSETDGERGRKAVDTTLGSPGDDDPTELIYQLHQDAGPGGGQSGGQWKIVDVYLDGSVSQLALRRNEFAAAMAAGGVDNLIAQMEKTSAGMAK